MLKDYVTLVNRFKMSPVDALVALRNEYYGEIIESDLWSLDVADDFHEQEDFLFRRIAFRAILSAGYSEVSTDNYFGVVYEKEVQ